MEIMQNHAKELIVFLLGAAPLSEVRGAIPVGILIYNFSALKTFLISVAGNIAPVLPLLILFKKLSEFLMSRFYSCNKFFNWLFEYTKKKHGDHFDRFKYVPLALFVFVAIPIPGTGAWSGVIAATVFGLSITEGFISVSLGAIAAGVIVTALTELGIFTVNSVFF